MVRTVVRRESFDKHVRERALQSKQIVEMGSGAWGNWQNTLTLMLVLKSIPTSSHFQSRSRP
jgi:hypothetical protein